MQSEFYTKRQVRRARPAARSTWRRASTSSRPTWCSTARSARSPATTRSQAKVGETRAALRRQRRARTSRARFHVIGEVFDNVYSEGGTRRRSTTCRRRSIPAGGAAIVEFGAEKPGNLILVDHSIFRAFNKGALGHAQGHRRGQREGVRVDQGHSAARRLSPITIRRHRSPCAPSDSPRCILLAAAHLASATVGPRRTAESSARTASVGESMATVPRDATGRSTRRPRRARRGRRVLRSTAIR